MSAVSVAPAPPVGAVRLRLLGPPAFEVGPRRVEFEADRAHGRLALLACRRDWLRRDELADLLFPGRDLEGARSNLRKVLYLARKIGAAGEIEQRGDLLRWAPESDLARFEQACDARRHADAVAAYGGPLLQGLDAAWPLGAREWLDAERRRLQSRWQEACSQRLAELADEPEALRELAAALLRVDPLDEEALQALSRAQQALGRTEEALAAVAVYARRLSSELALEPSVAVRRLADDLRRGATPPPPAAGPELVGRRHERTLLRERLSDPGCRVLTLLGPPGVGKSALARALAAEQGGAWAALEDVADADAAPARIAAACGLALEARLPPWEALARALGAAPRLLVLDNCEHLALAAPIGALLAAVPAMRMLATSRAPLGVAGEWRLPLDGLPLPDPDERDPEVLRANDAVRLFELRALATGAPFDLGTEAADVVRLVHEVAALPLALELLASWRRLMPASAILDELAQSLELLEGSAPGERSVRAAFERSWRQLGAAEQRVLAQIALLPAPCPRELLRRVLPAPLPVLAALVDRSLLQVGADGHFTLHPLIRRLAAPLAGDGEALLERHARDVAAALDTPSAAPPPLVHARAAWRWALAHRDTALLATMAPRHLRTLIEAAQPREALDGAQAALVLLDAAPGDAAALTEARIAVRVLQGIALKDLGEFDPGGDVARDALARAEAAQHAPQTAQALNLLGSLHWMRGRYDEAAAAFERQLAIVKPLGQTRALASCLIYLALVAKARGRYEEAVGFYRDLLAMSPAALTTDQQLSTANNHGNLLRVLGRDAEALAMLQPALERARRGGSPSVEPYLLLNLGLVHETTGRLGEAATWIERALACAAERGPPTILAAVHLARARVAARRTHARAALADVHAALAIERRLKSPPLEVQCLSTAGVVMAALGESASERARGVAIVRWAMQHPDFARSEREDAERHLQALGLAEAPFEPLAAEVSPAAVAALVPAG